MEFTEVQLRRYARHIILKELGGDGQAKLLASSALVIGAGGLGSPALYYLAAAGVGRIRIVDPDRVELSNLQRQILHREQDVGRPKVDSARDALAALNPDVAVEPIQVRFGPDNAAALLDGVDVVLDGSDNFSCRFLAADACHLFAKPLVTAAVLGFDGQIATFKSHLGAPHPCYRCVFPAPPPPGKIPSCAAAGVLGALPGQLGAMMATEAVKELTGIGRSLSGRLLLIDALAAETRAVTLKKRPACPLCGDAPRINDLSAHVSSAAS